MRVIEGTTIKINRGDILPLKLTIPISEEQNYVFQVGDVVRFAIYGKKQYQNEPFVLKEITIEEETEHVNFIIESEEMKFGELINKPVTYWYEVELNGEQTVIGYDDDGAKELILYPEGSEVV